MADRLLDIVQASDRLNRPIATLYDWRYRKVGPPSAKLGGKIYYRETDLEAWIEAQFAAAAGQ